MGSTSECGGVPFPNPGPGVWHMQNGVVVREGESFCLHGNDEGHLLMCEYCGDRPATGRAGATRARSVPVCRRCFEDYHGPTLDGGDDDA